MRLRYIALIVVFVLFLLGATQYQRVYDIWTNETIGEAGSQSADVYLHPGISGFTIFLNSTKNGTLLVYTKLGGHDRQVGGDVTVTANDLAIVHHPYPAEIVNILYITDAGQGNSVTDAQVITSGGQGL